MSFPRHNPNVERELNAGKIIIRTFILIDALRRLACTNASLQARFYDVRNALDNENAP
jgi:hypothetical protein